MIQIDLSCPPSLHNRSLRESFRQQCTARVPALEQRVYTVGFTIYGHFYDSDGQPTDRDADNIVKVALDEIALAGGLRSKRGKRWSDRFLQRQWSAMRVVESTEERVVVTLT